MEIEKTFCGRTDGRTHLSSNLLGHRRGDDLKTVMYYISKQARRPASADRTSRRQFQATGQPVSRTQASDATTSRLPRYEAKCVQHRCFQWVSVALRSDIKGTELPPANILKLCSRLLVLYCRNCMKDDKFRYLIPF